MWKTVLVAIWSGIKPTLQSKKVQTAIVASLVALGARLGLALNTETVALMITPFVAAIGAQGAADMKKPKPCPKCGALPEPEPAAPPVSPTQDPPAS